MSDTKLKADAANVKAGATKVKAGATKVKAGATKVKADAANVKAGATKVKAGATKVKAGATKVKAAPRGGASTADRSAAARRGSCFCPPSGKPPFRRLLSACFVPAFELAALLPLGCCLLPALFPPAARLPP